MSKLAVSRLKVTVFLLGRSGPLWMIDPQRKQLLALGKRMKREEGCVCVGRGTSQGDVGAVSVMLHIKASSAIYFTSYLSVARITGCTTTPGWSVPCSNNLEDSKHHRK